MNARRIACLLFLATTSVGHTAELTLQVRDANGPVADAVVALTAPEAVAPVSTEIYQKDRQFHPKVLIVPVGSTVDFPNRDNTQHHVYSFSPAKTFDIELYTGRPAQPVLFDQAGVVELGCNIHDHMQGFVIVTHTADIGQTDANGRVTLTPEPDDLSGDRIDVTVWHPRLPDATEALRRTLPLDNPPPITLELLPEPATDEALHRLQQRFLEL